MYMLRSSFTPYVLHADMHTRIHTYVQTTRYKHDTYMYMHADVPCQRISYTLPYL